MISIKEYAEKHNISYEAARKQIVRYSKELEGHITKQNRKQFIDEYAEEFLNERRQQNPVIVVAEEKNEELEKLKSEKEILLQEKIRLLEKIVKLNEELVESQKNVIALKDELMAIEERTAEEDEIGQATGNNEVDQVAIDEIQEEKPCKKWWHFWKK